MSDDEHCKSISRSTAGDLQQIQQIQERYERELTEIKGVVNALLFQRNLTICNHCNEIVQAAKFVDEGTSPISAPCVDVPIVDLGFDNHVEFSEDSQRIQRNNFSHKARGNTNLEGNNDNYLIFLI